jgi:Bardet-Biedl syndrome 9 protein
MDAIVVTTSDMQLECYRYQVLASASLKFNKQEKATPSSYSSSNSNNSHRTSTGMTGNFEWKLNLGEQILDIRLGKYHSEIGQSNYDLLVLTEFSLFCLRPNGDIVFQKRLGFQPSTLCLYRRLPQASEGSNDVGHSIHNAIITGHHKVWMIYGDKSLLWSACAPSIPVAMEVGEFGNLQGMIVALDAEGSLSINYLGTDPPSTSVGASDVAKEINYEEMDEEHRQLLNVIRRSQGERRIEPKERVLIRAQVPSMLDPIHSYDDIRRSSNRNTNNPEENAQVQLTMRIYVTYTGNSRVNNVTLSIQTPENIIASESSIVLDYIDGKSSTPLILPIVLRPSTNVMPRSLNVNIAAAYTLETGQPRVSQCQVKLPMCMMCRLIPPVKSSTFKFTLETNQDPPQLTDLFEDMLTQPGCTPEWAKQVGGSGTNVMSFQYYNGVDATILVSKNAGRYRIQSNELEALWMVSKELVERLEALYQSNDMRLSNSDSKQEHQQETASKFEVFYQEPLPLADFFGAIDAHFAQRKAKMELAAEINDRAHQFRIIQKRLLVRYKDRNPSALNCLEVLLHGTYEQLIQLSHAMEEVDLKLSMASNRLSCCVHLILMLIKYRFNLDDASGNTLASYLSPIINDHGEQGWEEATDSAMTELLRTLLAKTQTKDNNQTNNNASLLTQELTMLEDTKKLKKHITIVCDRLGKGAILSDSGSSSTSSGSSTPQEAK